MAHRRRVERGCGVVICPGRHTSGNENGAWRLFYRSAGRPTDWGTTLLSSARCRAAPGLPCRWTFSEKCALRRCPAEAGDAVHGVGFFDPYPSMVHWHVAGRMRAWGRIAQLGGTSFTGRGHGFESCFAHSDPRLRAVPGPAFCVHTAQCADASAAEEESMAAVRKLKTQTESSGARVRGERCRPGPRSGVILDSGKPQPSPSSPPR